MGYLSPPCKADIMKIVGVKTQILIHFPEMNATLCKRHILICILVCQALDVSCGENELKLSRYAFTLQSAQLLDQVSVRQLQVLIF